MKKYIKGVYINSARHTEIISKKDHLLSGFVSGQDLGGYFMKIYI